MHLETAGGEEGQLKPLNAKRKRANRN